MIRSNQFYHDTKLQSQQESEGKRGRLIFLKDFSIPNMFQSSSQLFHILQFVPNSIRCYHVTFAESCILVLLHMWVKGKNFHIYIYVFLILTSVDLLVIRIFAKTLIHSSPFLQAYLLIIQCASSHEIQLALQFLIPYFAKQSRVLFVLQLFNYFFDIYGILYILNIAQFVPFFGFIFEHFCAGSS